ncbi:SRPBCC domain-containing protein [Arachidicoccus soli]|uniref:SRPBCC domain-containing protein n=1 Tax=Arachidicoccus soli TaxID=2341117 RepID=UPI001F088CCD|nr:SRPBCC domain-containing protein [Arachidicoccus soli]
MEKWRAPKGMKCVIYEFDSQPGGIYRMTLKYTGAHETAGKSSENEDMVKGRFLEMVPNNYVVEEVEFPSDDPEYAGLMKVKTQIDPVPEGSLVTFVCMNVPAGITKEDHEKGLSSTLQNLANS